MRWIILVGLLAPALVRAQSGDAVLELLLRKGLISSQDVTEVKQKLDAEMAQAVAKYEKTKTPTWVREMNFSGDLRLRADYNSPEASLNVPDRLRFRVRLRLAVETRFNDWSQIALRLATGDGDPVATNQSFTDTFRKKPVNIDLAYVALQWPGSDSVRLLAGKMPNPIWQSALAVPMVYDPDLTPEGLGEQHQIRFGDRRQWRLFANFGQFSVKEFARDSADTYLFDFLGGAELKLPAVRATVAGGYSVTHNLALVKPGDSPNLGNSVSASTNYVADYHVGYIRGDLAITVADKPFLGTPAVVTCSGETIQNFAKEFAGQPNGWSAQIMFGEAKKKGQWSVLYQYRRLEADATWDAVTDSDFGIGGTDRQGHVVRAAYNPQDWWQLGLNATVTEKISDTPNTGHNNVGAEGETILRLQGDSSFRF